jgi:hypothetical protein
MIHTGKQGMTAEGQFPVDVIDLAAKANALTQERDEKLENERKTKKRSLHESDNSGNSTR